MAVDPFEDGIIVSEIHYIEAIIINYWTTYLFDFSNKLISEANLSLVISLVLGACNKRNILVSEKINF